MTGLNRCIMGRDVNDESLASRLPDMMAGHRGGKLLPSDLNPGHAARRCVVMVIERRWAVWEGIHMPTPSKGGSKPAAKPTKK